MKTLEFLYQETQIHFLLNPTDDNVMINATEMAKLFNRRTEDFLKTQTTKAFIEEMENNVILPLKRGQIIDNRGRNGIWFCEELSLDFASWLDPAFKLWIYRTIKELLRGQTKRVKKAVDHITEAEIQLQKLINDIDNSDNKEAKAVIKAFHNYNCAKAEKTKALKELTQQLKIEF